MQDESGRRPIMETTEFEVLAGQVGEELRRILRSELGTRYKVVDAAAGDPVWRVCAYDLRDDGDGCIEHRLFHLELADGERLGSPPDGDALIGAHEALREDLARVVAMGTCDGLVPPLSQLEGMAISIDIANRRSVTGKADLANVDEIILGLAPGGMEMEVWPWEEPISPGDTDKNEEE